jgi:hypothetical protein
MDDPSTCVKIACSQVVVEALVAGVVAVDTVVVIKAVVAVDAPVDAALGTSTDAVMDTVMDAAVSPVAAVGASFTSAISHTTRRGKISKTTSDSVGT